MSFQAPTLSRCRNSLRSIARASANAISPAPAILLAPAVAAFSTYRLMSGPICAQVSVLARLFFFFRPVLELPNRDGSCLAAGSTVLLPPQPAHAPVRRPYGLIPFYLRPHFLAISVRNTASLSEEESGGGRSECGGCPGNALRWLP